MKTLVRIGLILAASLVVIGGAFAYVQYGGNTLLTSGPGRGEMFEGGQRPERGQAGEAFTPSTGGAFAGEAPPDFGGERGAGREGGHESGGLGGLTEVLRNLGVMAVITLIVAGIGTAWRFLSSKLRRPPSAVAPPAPPAQPTA